MTYKIVTNYKKETPTIDWKLGAGVIRSQIANNLKPKQNYA